jgi:hypothetical protein
MPANAAQSTVLVRVIENGEFISTEFGVSEQDAVKDAAQQCQLPKKTIQVDLDDNGSMTCQVKTADGEFSDPLRTIWITV